MYNKYLLSLIIIYISCTNSIINNSNSSNLSSGCTEQTQVCLNLDGSNLNYESDYDIYGFQINHNGCIVDASGGDAAVAGFMISTSESVVLGFSLIGTFIPGGEGILVVLSGNITEDCIDELVFSGENGASLSSALEIALETSISGDLTMDLS